MSPCSRISVLPSCTRQLNRGENADRLLHKLSGNCRLQLGSTWRFVSRCARRLTVHPDVVGGGTCRAATSSAAFSGATALPTPRFRPLNAGGVVAARQPLPTTSGCTGRLTSRRFGLASPGGPVYRFQKSVLDLIRVSKLWNVSSGMNHSGRSRSSFWRQPPFLPVF